MNKMKKTNMPGFTAEKSLYRKYELYRSATEWTLNVSSDGKVKAAQDEGSHCWWDSPFCDEASHTMYVRCVRWINGMPQHYTQAVGSC